jgi:hypothetical protein
MAALEELDLSANFLTGGAGVWQQLYRGGWSSLTIKQQLLSSSVCSVAVCMHDK